MRVDRRAFATLSALARFAITALEIAFGFFHVVLSVAKALLALHAEALELALQLGETVAQLLLAIAELRLALVSLILTLLVVLVGIIIALIGSVRTLLVLLGLRVLVLVRRRLAALRALARTIFLVAAEGVVAQSLLVAKEFVEFADLFAHLAFGRAFLVLLRVAHVLEHLLHLIQHGLRIFARTVARGLHLVHHLVQILRLSVLVLGFAVGRVAGHLAHEAIGRLAQLLHQLLDFLIASAALERFAKRLLGCAQVVFGFRGVAVLELLGHRPEQGRDVQEISVAVGALERGLGLLQTQIDIGWRVKQFRRNREPLSAVSTRFGS